MSDIDAAVKALKSTVDVLKSNPELLNAPQLAFFKEYLESLGATIPGSKPSASAADKPAESAPPPPQQKGPIVEEPDDDEEEEKEEPEEIDPDVISRDEADIDPPQELGEVGKEASEAEEEAAGDARAAAMDAMGEGNLELAVAKFSAAILAAPSANLLATRGTCFLKMKKPLAAIRDATRALEHNADSAKAYKLRGKAHCLLGDWKEAVKDLGTGQNIDYDEDSYELQKKAKAHVEKEKERERKKKEREEKRQKKLREQRAREMAESQAGAAGAGFPGMGGMGGFPGMGGMGGFPGMGGMGGMPGGMPGVPPGMDFGKLMSDPEIAAAMSNPKLMQVFMEVQQNPGALMKYKDDPEVMGLVMKIQGAMGGGGGMPGM